jgi:hypothetical protein
VKRLPGGPTQPLTVHLRQEIDRLNKIVALTTTTLKDLRLAIAGKIFKPVFEAMCCYSLILSVAILMLQGIFAKYGMQMSCSYAHTTTFDLSGTVQALLRLAKT